MESTNFCYWLQGFFELSDVRTLTEKQVQTIKNHLNLVFIHEIDPKMDEKMGTDPQFSQAVHDGIKPSPWPEGAKC